MKNLRFFKFLGSVAIFISIIAKKKESIFSKNTILQNHQANFELLFENNPETEIQNQNIPTTGLKKSAQTKPINRGKKFPKINNDKIDNKFLLFLNFSLD